MQAKLRIAVFILWMVHTMAASVPVRASEGLITMVGPTGMFFNPQAEVSPQKTINAQACWIRQDLPEGIVNANILMVAHTLPTATELGLLATLVTPKEAVWKRPSAAFFDSWSEPRRSGSPSCRYSQWGQPCSTTRSR
jgi:hypothetical protein